MAMFTKKEKEAESYAPAVEETVIAEGTFFKGDFSTTSPVLIMGKFEGNIDSTSSVVVTETGSYIGNGVMQSLEVAGIVNADIKCSEYTKIFSTGTVSGSLATARLLTDDGSTFDGQLAMLQPTKHYTEEE